MADKIHEYARKPLRRCLESLLNSLKVLHLCMRGISMVTATPRMIQRVIDLTVQVGRDVTADVESDLEMATKEADFAESERKNGFPFLHAYSLVGAWGALEAAVEDMVVGILANEPEALDKEEFAKIRVPLSKFEVLDREDRIRFLVSEVERTLSVGAGQGVDTFEKLLQVIGLSGTVEGDTKKMLWEMNHVRNVIVHRDSLADLRLVQACPWLNLKVGDHVPINHQKYGLYHDAEFAYVKVLVRRLAERYGAPVPDWAVRPKTVDAPPSTREKE